jgi:hypothetical protein
MPHDLVTYRTRFPSALKAAYDMALVHQVDARITINTGTAGKYRIHPASDQRFAQCEVIATISVPAPKE